jgi:hypothetical protein
MVTELDDSEAAHQGRLTSGGSAAWKRGKLHLWDECGTGCSEARPRNRRAAASDAQRTQLVYGRSHAGRPVQTERLDGNA